MNRSAPAACAALAAIGLWLGLAAMLVHELGHVAAAWLTGGTISSLELRPGRLSHTLVQPNPRPGVVLWSGFLFGWIVPQLSAPLWRIERGLIGPTLRAGAAFCLLAGGTYLAIGGGERLTDAGQLAALGWPMFILTSAGVAVAATGYWRSRTAWRAVAKTLGERGVTTAAAVGWWFWLAAWWVGQHAVALRLQP